MREKNLNMTMGHPARLLMSFALPLMAGNIFQQLYMVVDTAIVGQGVGMNALAALGSVDWMNWMYLGIAQGIAQGFSVRMSQKFGQGDGAGLKRVLGVSVRLTVLVAIVTLIGAQLALEGFLVLLQVPEALRGDAMLYSRIILMGIPAMLYYNFTASVLRSVGDSRTPLAAMVVAALLNILLDYVAVFWLEWGIGGAAGATVLSQCLAGTFCAIKIIKTPMLRFTRQDMARDRNLDRNLLAMGLPLAGYNVVIAVGGMVVQAVVNGFETPFIAGYTATNKLYGVLEIAALSYGYAVTTYTGQNFGAMLWQRIRSGTRWAVVVSLVTSVVIGGCMIFFGRDITMIFLASESVEEMAAAGRVAYLYLCAMAAMLPVLYLLYVYRSALQGIGNGRIPLISGIVEFVIRVCGAILVAYSGWQEGIFVAEVSAWAGSAILLTVAYYCLAARFGDNIKNPQKIGE